MKILKLAVFLSAMLLMLAPFSAAQAKQRTPPVQSLQAPAKNADGIMATFVELGSINCMPCKMMQPVMKEIEDKYKGRVKVVFYDVWTNEGKPFGELYKVRAIPTQVFLDKDGKEFFRHMGYFPAEEIVKILEKQGLKHTTGSDKTPAKTKNADQTSEPGQLCK